MYYCDTGIIINVKLTEGVLVEDQLAVYPNHTRPPTRLRSQDLNLPAAAARYCKAQAGA